MGSQVRILPGAPFPCKTGHLGASACGAGSHSALKGFSGPADLDFVSLDDHLVDEQTRIGLAQSRIVCPKSIAEHLAESTKHVRRNAALGRCELPLQNLSAFTMSV